MERFEITLDGTTVPATRGDTILAAATRAGLEDRIPTLCYEPGLPPYTSCFVCVVELEGRDRLLPACSTRRSPGWSSIRPRRRSPPPGGRPWS